jgi:hypothetical protein
LLIDAKRAILGGLWQRLRREGAAWLLLLAARLMVSV